MGKLNDIKDEIVNRLSELKDDEGTFIKEVYDYPEFTPTSFPAVSVNLFDDSESGTDRTNMRNNRVIQFVIYIFVPQLKDSQGFEDFLNCVDQIRTHMRVKGFRDTLNGVVTKNRGIIRVELDEVKSNQDFSVYAAILELEVLESLG